MLALHYTPLLQSAAEEAGGHHIWSLAYVDQFATVGHPDWERTVDDKTTPSDGQKL